MSYIQGIAPPDTSPVSAIPLPTLPLPSLPTLPDALPTPALPSIPARPYSSLAKADRLILQLNRMLSTPAGTDTLLLTINYTSVLTAYLLRTLSAARTRHNLNRLLVLLRRLPPNTTVLLTPTPGSKIPPSRLLHLAARLSALASLISDFRIFARLWGLVGIYAWGKSVWTADEKDVVQRRLAKAQVLVNAAFQVLENGAYLAGKGVLLWNPKIVDEAWLWSSRFWAVSVGLEFGRLAYEVFADDRKSVKSGSAVTKSEGEGNTIAERDARAVEQAQAETQAWRRSLLLNTMWAPLTLHWSVNGGLVSDLVVGACGSVVGFVKMRALYGSTSEE